MTEQKKGALLPGHQKVAGRFEPGHPKFGGRKPGSPNKRTVYARSLVEKLSDELGRNVDPLEALLRVSADEQVALDIRIDCMKACLPFLYPRLQSTAFTNATGDGPVEIAEAKWDITAILRDPETAKAAQKVALAVALARAEETKAIPE